LIFSGKAELPCYFKSIITPDGGIYLTGGSEGKFIVNLRGKTVERYLSIQLLEKFPRFGG
jgi:hypothetical protein